MKLQIAFDFIDLDQSLRVAGETSPPADWLEVGTSLIKSAGIVAVRRFKEGFQKKRDRGRHENPRCRRERDAPSLR